MTVSDGDTQRVAEWEVPKEAITNLAVDLITTAAEGGINYWAEILAYKWTDPRYDGESVGRTACLALREGEYDEDDDDVQDYFVDGTLMIQTIEDVLAGKVKPFGSLGYGESFNERMRGLLDELSNGVDYLDADFDFDADDADCMVQVACFGQVIYG